MPDTPGKRKLEETDEVKTVHRQKTKHRKTFLDSRQEALSLAALVVDAEEQKFSKKAERMKATKHPLSHPSSKTRSRLEERKEAIAAQVTRAKRNRTKSRKSQLNSGHSKASGDCQDNKAQVRKSVTLA